MRVLLIGEASGVHNNLKAGLVNLGVRVDHYVHRPLIGRSGYDGVFAQPRPGLVGGITRNIEPLLKLLTLSKYSVISMCNTITSVHGTYTKYFDVPFLKRKCEILSHYALGCDEISLIRKSKTLPYTPCETCLSSNDTLSNDCRTFFNPRYESSTKLVNKYFDFGASSMVEYDHASKAFAGKIFDRIQLPVHIEHIEFKPPQATARLKIMHTPTRRGFKGTNIVLHAMEMLAERRSDFDFRIIEGLRYVDYVRAIADADVIVDQVHGQSPGMNALEMLAAGKIVFSGATSIARSYFDFSGNLPVFDASPNPVELMNSISSLLDRRQEISDLAAFGRQYVKLNHDPTLVASLFLDGWRRAGVNIRGSE